MLVTKSKIYFLTLFFIGQNWYETC